MPTIIQPPSSHDNQPASTGRCGSDVIHSPTAGRGLTSWGAWRPSEGRSPSHDSRDGIAKVTTIRYRDWLSSLWLLDPLPAWRPAGSPLRRLIAGPKHHLCDPALAARLLDVDATELLDGEGRTLAGQGPLLGSLFESLCTLSVRAIAQSCDARVSHLRTHRGEREVDLIVEGRAGRIVGIEITLSAAVEAGDVKNLHWLRDELGRQVQDLVVLTTGSEAYRRGDGVAVIPLALLGP